MVEGVGLYEYWRGWNVWAGLAVLLGLLPCLPGFLVAARIISEPSASSSPLILVLVELYHYAWFVAITISFGSYYCFMRWAKWHGQSRYEQLLGMYKKQHKPDRERREETSLSASCITNYSQPEQRGMSADGQLERSGRTSSVRERDEEEKLGRRGSRGKQADTREYYYTSGPHDLAICENDQQSPDGVRFASPTIEKYHKEQQRERQRRSRQLVAQWRRRQEERAKRHNRGQSTGEEGQEAEDGQRYVFFQEDICEEPAKDEEEEKNARRHFVE